MKLRPPQSMPLNPYPYEAYPVVVREAIEEMVANTQVPIALASTVFLASMSATMQRDVEVRLPIGGSPRPTSLFSVVIALSGERKSAVENLVMAPIRKMDAELVRLHKVNEAMYRAQHELWTARKKGLLSDVEAGDGDDYAKLAERLAELYQEEPVRPKLRQILHQDLSERALVDKLEGDGESISIVCDEGEIALSSILLAKTGLLNAAWSGGHLSLARGNGILVSAKRPRVSLSILVQPEVIEDHLRKKGVMTRGSGFWSRVLLCYPVSTQGMRFISPSADQKWDKLNAFHHRQSAILMRRLDSVQHHFVYDFDDDARQLWIAFVNNIETQLQPFGHLSEFRDIASKSAEMVVRIAALFDHFAERHGKISVDTLRRAGRLVEYHIEEFRRLFSPEVEVPQFQIDGQALELYLRRTWWTSGATFAPKNLVLQKGPVRPRRRLDEALQWLSIQGRVTLNVGPKKRQWIGLPSAQQAGTSNLSAYSI